MKLKTVLIDDEKKIRELIRILLTKHCPEVEIAGEAEDAFDGLNLIRRVRPELVFLDIQMRGETGIQMLKNAGCLDFEVIFVTGYDQFVLEALRLNAVDYILKPPDPELMKNAVAKAMTRIAAGNTNRNIVQVVNSFAPEEEDKCIAAHLKDKVCLVRLGEILYVEGRQNYISVVTTSEAFVITKSMAEFEALAEPSGVFMRISKGVMINVRQVKEYSKGEPCIVTLSNGKQFEASRRKKTSVLSRLTKFMAGKGSE